MITAEEIDKLAALARLALSTEERERMRNEFDSILGYLATIQKISAVSASGGRSIITQTNVMREDANPHESGIYTEALIGAAPKKEGDYIKVKKIL